MVDPGVADVWHRWKRPLQAGSLLFGAWIAWEIGPPWIGALWTGLVPSTRRTLAIGVLNGTLIAYALTLFLAVVGGGTATLRLLSGRRLGRRRPYAARVALLSISSLFGLLLLELGAVALEAWDRRPPPVPRLPPRIIDTAGRLPDVPGARAPSRDLLLLVVGESSAQGQPYEPWFSIGQAVAWQVERAMPGRKVRVKMEATGGIALSPILETLNKQTERPDIVVLYSGHNEFQARWGWSRIVNYYRDDGTKRPREGLADAVGDITPLTALVHKAVDRQQVDRTPMPRGGRAVVERPVCEPRLRRELSRLFARELDTIATWCELAGAVPIFVLPAGNDVGYDPGRSLMSPDATLADREAFTDEFLAARKLDTGDRDAAIASYRRLIARQPMFAESHFRLAQHLQAKGQISEARAEYVLARDLDGLPMRCPSEFQAAYREVAARHPVVLVDAPACLEALSPTGLLDDNVFHDGQHPTLLAYIALAQNAVDQMRTRGLFHLDEAALPPIDPAECAAHFGIAGMRWVDVCGRSASFWVRLAPTRYDPTDRLFRAKRYQDAVEAIVQGKAPEQANVPGLGVHPPGWR